MTKALSATLLKHVLPGARPHRAVEPLSVPVYAMLAAALVIIAAAIAATDFSYDAASLNPPLLCLVVLAVCALGLRRVGYPRVAGMIETTTVLAALSVAGAFASLIGAASAHAYADALLIRADAALFFGFDWRAAIAAVADRDMLLRATSYVYASLHWQPSLLVVALFATGQGGRCWTFVTAWAMTLAATIAIFPFLPALGGYLHFGIMPADVPGVRVAAAWRHVEILGPVRDGTLRLLTARTVEGVVTFPSFHAGAAVLLAWGFWGLRWLRWPFVALNAAMFAASAVIGGHYLVDLAAGGLIAAVGIIAAKALLAPIAARQLSPSSAPASPSARTWS